MELARCSTSQVLVQALSKLARVYAERMGLDATNAHVTSYSASDHSPSPLSSSSSAPLSNAEAPPRPLRIWAVYFDMIAARLWGAAQSYQEMSDPELRAASLATAEVRKPPLPLWRQGVVLMFALRALVSGI